MVNSISAPHPTKSPVSRLIAAAGRFAGLPGQVSSLVGRLPNSLASRYPGCGISGWMPNATMHLPVIFLPVAGVIGIGALLFLSEF